MVPTSKVHEYTLTVVSNEPCAQGLYRAVVSSPELAAALRPGQFVNIRVPRAAQILRVPLSFASADAKAGTIELVYATVGDATRALARMAPGESAPVLGPSGNAWPVEAGQGRSIVVAGGVGIAPVVACARELACQGIPFDAVVGAQTAERLWGADVLADLVACRVAVTTYDGSAGTRGFATYALRALLARGGYERVYTCGPQVMMAGVARLCHEAGVACLVSMERMMSCAFGACGTCNVSMAAGGYKSCCMDGPVFDAEEVAW